MALLSWVELQQVGAAVVVASVVAAVGHRNLHRRVVRSGGQKILRSEGHDSHLDWRLGESWIPLPGRGSHQGAESRSRRHTTQFLGSGYVDIVDI